MQPAQGVTPGGPTPPTQIPTPEPAKKNSNCYPTGMGIYSTAYKANFCACDNVGDEIWHPFLGNKMAKRWEVEREACRDGDCLVCLESCCVLRTCHVVSTLFDTIFCLASPLICVGGSLSALSCFCLSNCASLVSLAHCNSDARQRLRGQSEELIRSSGGVCVATTRLTGGLIGIGMCDLMKLPINILAPEAASVLCGQEEFNLCFHRMIGEINCD